MRIVKGIGNTDGVSKAVNDLQNVIVRRQKRFKAVSMAPVKRKHDRSNDSPRPEKKQKQKQKPATTMLSVLRKEEPAFPRGGASILTPLEQKQIQVQAKQDVLFEQSTGKKPKRDEFEEEEGDENAHMASAPTTKTKRKSRTAQKKGRKDAMIMESSVRIEGLSYKVGRPMTQTKLWLKSCPASRTWVAGPRTNFSD